MACWEFEGENEHTIVSHDDPTGTDALAGDQANSRLLADLRRGLASAQESLMGQRTAHRHWVGRLSASSLSTATAISALATFARHSQHPYADQARERIVSGLDWLDRSQNQDGGFGDTDRSPSNIASSYLALAAWTIADAVDAVDRGSAIERVQRYIDQAGAYEGLKRRYGTDKTFVVPILSNCAIAGLVPWSQVASLPFELAALPQSVYRFVQMPVVSYAIPALVAIGQARFHHEGTRNWVAHLVRSVTRRRTLGVLQAMQPASGGYLEATPLTSFVLMNLASMDLAEHNVSMASVRFLLGSQLPDGSWPIDEDLSTWLTSLSISALGNDRAIEIGASPAAIDPATIDWLLDCQHAFPHRFTGADPGGWGWTDLSGAVPDADDTPAALLALHWCCCQDGLDDARRRRIEQAADAGVDWLLGMQNRDGGWPTFCRGWGKLPFDRSGSDLTAHAIRALLVWKRSERAKSIDRAIDRAIVYLHKTQRADGSWLPLWFGNHDVPEDENPVYGTARVLLALEKLQPKTSKAYRRGCDYLIKNQNPDGGWGGGESVTRWLNQQGFQSFCQHNGQKIRSSVEECAVALEALAGSGSTEHRASIIEGARFLLDAIDQGRCKHPWPIGFYFAKLWYHERLYPWVFSNAALGRVITMLNRQ